MRRALLLALVVLGSGCGGDDNGEPGAPTVPPAPTGTEVTPTVRPEPDARNLLVYFLRDGKVAATKRRIPGTAMVGRAALTALIAGPTADETEIGFESEVPADLSIDALTVAGGVAQIDLSSASGCPSMAQIVYTLTQFQTVQRVAGNCLPDGPAGRGDFEDVTPAILVESPAPFEEVASPLRLVGTANTFEANFQIELVDWDGRIIHEQFATATSGSGTRGTFDVTIPFDVDLEGGAVIVLERSAKDGSRINLVEIPLRLQP